MPYKSIEELPGDVRDALPAPAQRIFLKVANKALDGGAADEKAFKAAWAAVKIAGFRKQKDGKWKKAVEGEMAEDKLLALCEVQAVPEPPPKDWDTVEDLDVSIRAELPPEAQAIFLDAYKAVAGVYHISHWQAMDAGWNAVREAGWHYPVQQWVKISTEDGDQYGEADYQRYFQEYPGHAPPEGIPAEGIATVNFAGSPRNAYGTHGSFGFKGGADGYKKAWRLHFSQIGGGARTPAAGGPIRGTVRRVAMIAAAMKPACDVRESEGIGPRTGPKSPLSGSYPQKPSDYGLSSWKKPSDDDVDRDKALRMTCQDLNVIKAAATAEVKRRAADREKATKAAEQFIADGGGDLVALIGKTGEFRFLNDMPLEAGEVPDWIQVLPAPGSWQHPRYGEIKITDEVLEEFRANFENEVYQKHIPIDAEHETQLSGALGYYESVVIGGPAGEGGLWAKVEWTDRGEELLESERFKYFSPAWFEEWDDPASGETYKNVLNGGALTTRPFFKDEALKPLVAREGGMWEVTLAEAGKADRWIELRRGNVAPTAKKEEAGILPDKMTEDQLRELVEAESKKAVETATSELKAEVAGHKQATDLANMAREAAEGRVKTLEDGAKHRRFTDIVLGRDDASDGARPMIGDIQAHVQLLETIADAKGEDSEDFKRYVFIQRSHAESAHKAGLFSEAGVGGGDGAPETAGAEVQKLVEKKMSEKPDLSREDAISQVANENPELWDKRDREHTGRRTPLPK